MGTYTHGYAAGTMRTMAARTAERQAGFFVPRLAASMRLLDVGCGPDSITLGLAAAVAPGEVIGVDIESSQVERARALAAERGVANARFEVASGDALPFSDGSFDAAFEHTVLEHVADPLAALREMRRVLRPGGLVGLRDGDWGTTVTTPPCPALEQAMTLYEPLRRHNGGDARFGRRQRPMLRDAGFTPLETTYGVATLPLPTVVSRLTAADFGSCLVDLGWVDRATVETWREPIEGWGDTRTR